MRLSIREAVGGDVLPIVALHGEALALVRRVYRPRPEKPRTGGRSSPVDGDPDAAEPARAVQLVAIVHGDAEDELVGGVSCRIEGEQEPGGARLHLQSLQVLPAYHRRGVARRLVAEAARLAVDLGATRLSLETIRETGNVAIFARLGFGVVDARRSDRFELVDGGGDAETVTMERPLQGPP